MASSLSWSDSNLVECCEDTDDSCKLAPSADDTPTLMADLGWALLRVALAQTLDRRSSADSPALRAQALVQASVCGSAYQSCAASAASSCASFSSCRSDRPSLPIYPSPRSIPACAGIDGHPTLSYAEDEADNKPVEEACQVQKGYGLATSSPRASASTASSSCGASPSTFPLFSSDDDDRSSGSLTYGEDSLGVCSPPSPAVPLHQHTKPRAATTTSCKGFRICVVRPCGLVHTQRCDDLAAWAASHPPRRSSCSALPSAPIPVPSPSQQACRRRSDPGAVAAAQPFLDLPCPGEGVEAVGRRDPAQNPILVAVRDYYEAYRRQRETAPPHKPPEPCRRVVGFEL